MAQQHDDWKQHSNAPHNAELHQNQSFWFMCFALMGDQAKKELILCSRGH
jgi:hypothetical protein